MVHLVALEGDAGAVGQAAQWLQNQMDGWVRLRPGVYIVATHLAAAQVQNLLGGGAQVLAAQLTGAWGAIGLPEVANWMTGAKRAF